MTFPAGSGEVISRRIRIWSQTWQVLASRDQNLGNTTLEQLLFNSTCFIFFFVLLFINSDHRGPRVRTDRVHCGCTRSRFPPRKVCYLHEGEKGLSSYAWGLRKFLKVLCGWLWASCTPGSMNRLFSDLFKKIEGSFWGCSGLFGGAWGRFG